MKSKKMLVLVLLVCITGFSIQAQTTRLKANQKAYPFNPDYPDFYYGDEKVFLEGVFYQRNADVKTYKARYLILFSGMSLLPNGTKKYVASNWGFNTLDEFIYYKNLIENKKYYKIKLKEPKEGLLSDIIVLMHPKRKIPKI